MDFPHGKRNKIILCGRELDNLLEFKIKEQDKQSQLEKEIREFEDKKIISPKEEEKLEGLKK